MRRPTGSTRTAPPFPYTTLFRSAELKDPKLIVEYVEAYVAKRKQLAQNAIKSRSRLERKLAALKRDKDRAIDAYTKEAMTVEELKEKLPPIREAIAAVEVELSRQPEIPDTVALHPQEIGRAHV